MSKFLTLTACNVTSITVPFAPYLSIVIQSPGRSISFADNCIPAIKPSKESLNTSISTAADAPKPAIKAPGDSSVSTAIITISPIKKASTCNTCTKPLTDLPGCLRLKRSFARFNEELTTRIKTTIIQITQILCKNASIAGISSGENAAGRRV
ncbi:hypothetical protein Barb4_02739 [Bacteroidales bacterium Barb4]|nr:hypothetical protein Barb4_02739 [Bacteroidales bacterium Barb4]